MSIIFFLKPHYKRHGGGGIVAVAGGGPKKVRRKRVYKITYKTKFITAAEELGRPKELVKDAATKLREAIKRDDNDLIVLHLLLDEDEDL